MKTLNKVVKAFFTAFAVCLLLGKGMTAFAATNNDTTVTVNVNALRVRENPSLSAKCIGYVNRGDEFTFVDGAGDEWVAIDYCGQVAYVYGGYVSINYLAPLVIEESEKEEVSEMKETIIESVIPIIVEFSGKEEDFEKVTIEAEVENTSPIAPVTENEEVSESDDKTKDAQLIDLAEVFSDELTEMGKETTLEEETMVVSDSEDVLLLAALIQCEAIGECFLGQVAVGDVVMNRVADPRYPGTIRDVIYQRNQFSPIRVGKVDRILASGNINPSCLQAAREAVAGASVVDGCLNFRRANGKAGIVIEHHVFF